MHTLYYECFSGISGDMNMAALIDLGVDVDRLKSELVKLRLPGWELITELASRSGISGTMVTVVQTRKETSHRHLADIRKIIDSSDLDDQIKKTSLAIFSVIAEAEAKVHNSSPEKIHFHEVGAVDSIIDVVGAAICINLLGIKEVIVSVIELGGGTVKCEHGVLPVPAPATAEIVKGLPVSVNGVSFEATTPTGAAILKATGNIFGGRPAFKIIRTGYGIGHKTGTERPNILRVSLVEHTGASESSAAYDKDDAWIIETNIDDMNPEWYENLLTGLLDSGASDAWLTNIIMKKGRPGTMVSVLSDSESKTRLENILLSHSTTLGLRVTAAAKRALQREYRKIQTPFGQVTVKIGYLEGKVVSVKPEHEECSVIARREGISLQEVNRVVMAAVKL